MPVTINMYQNLLRFLTDPKYVSRCIEKRFRINEVNNTESLVAQDDDGSKDEASSDEPS